MLRPVHQQKLRSFLIIPFFHQQGRQLRVVALTPLLSFLVLPIVCIPEQQNCLVLPGFILHIYRILLISFSVACFPHSISLNIMVLFICLLVFLQ